MIKGFVIGDCHTARLNVASGIRSDVKFWGIDGLNAYSLPNQYAEFKKTNFVCKYDENGNLLKTSITHFNDYQDAENIYICVGYVDIKQNLPKYKNSDEIVKKLVEESLLFFKDKKLYFIEPFPQFVDTTFDDKENNFIYTFFDFKSRFKENNNYLKALKKYCKMYNIPILISQNNIYDVLGFNIFDKKVSFFIDNKYIDAVKPEHYKIISDYLISKILDKNTPIK
jgi:hypothetical protein